jgi:SH3 domain protein
MTEFRERRRSRGLPMAWIACLALASLAAPAARAEVAWVRDTILSVRPDPGRGERIAIVRSGDKVTILERDEQWTRVRLEDGTEGWITQGFLRSEPPPVVSVEKHERQTGELRDALESATLERDELSEANATLVARDEKQRAEIEQLTRENLELRAGARWPEWITGASVLLAGMLLGIFVHRSASRRPSPRIRL